MSVTAMLGSMGGVARARDLIEGGVSKYHLAAGIRSGTVMRPRRGWVALPGANADLVRAARQGVILTCVTQATRTGLWVAQSKEWHVAASGAARAQATGCRVHWAQPILPRPPGTLADPVQNVLQYVAACQPFEHALVIWESALNKKLVDLASLVRLPFRGQARRLLEISRPFADSGLESLAASRLRWLGVRLVQQAHLFGHRVDLLIGERLVLQIDGGTHIGKQRDRDNDFDAFLKLRGYHVIRVGYASVMSDWHEVQAEIMEAVAQGLHLAS